MAVFSIIRKVKDILLYLSSSSEENVQRSFSDPKKMDRIVLLYTITYCIYLFLFPIFPPDDVFRHVVSYRLGYDLRSVFFESYWPSFNPYILFDVIAGFLHRLFGLYSIQIIQGIIFILTVIALRKISKDTFLNHSVILMYIAICLTFSDYLSARPKALINALFLLSLGYPQKSPLLILTAIPLYSIFWLYIPPLIIYHYKRKKTVFWLSGVLLLGLSFWLIYGGKEYVTYVWKLINVKKLRVPGIIVTENISPIPDIGLSLFLFYPFFLYAIKEKASFFAGLYFIFINQIRFIPSLMPIALRFFRFEESKNKIRLPYIFVLFFFIIAPLLKGPSLLHADSDFLQDVKGIFSSINADISTSSLERKESRQENSEIRLLGSSLYFSFVYTYLYGGRGRIKIAPPPEIGFLNPELQRSTLNPDCKILHKYNVRYYVSSVNHGIDENALKCLSLLKATKTFNLYAVQ